MISRIRLKTKLFLQFFFIALIFISLVVKNSFAIELYSIIENNNKLNSGLILDINDSEITLLLLDGILKKLPQKDVSAILVYNILQNPFSALHINSELSEFLREVYIENGDKPSFVGLPVKLFNDMAIFFDISGKTHVHELSRINKLRSYKFIQDQFIKLNNYKSINLKVGDVPLTDKKVELKQDGIYPTKIIYDKIKIYDFFSDFQEGFYKINNYRERTYVYAKPFLFEKTIKLSNVFLFWGKKLNGKDLFNTYFQWSTGTSHGFQTKTIAGGAPCEWTPALSPLWTLQSEIKSHFFNTTFVGNINPSVLPAGNRYYTGEDDFINQRNEAFGAPADNSSSERLKSFAGDNINDKLIVDYDPYVTSHINYLLLLGLDYGHYSLAAGMYYPIYAIRVKNHFREIVASRNSPFLKFIFLKGDIRIKCMFSVTRYHEKNVGVINNLYSRYLVKRKTELVETDFGFRPMLSEDIYGYSEYNNDNLTPVRSFRFKSYFTRLGISYDLTTDIKFGIDGVILSGKYNETFIAEEIQGEDFFDLYLEMNNLKKEKTYYEYLNSIRFLQINTGVYFHQNFSDYVALKVIYNYYIRQYEYNFFYYRDKITRMNYEYGGAFELVF